MHAILQRSPRKRASNTRVQTPALLKGLLFGPGGAAFSPTQRDLRGALADAPESEQEREEGESDGAGAARRNSRGPRS